MDRRSFRRGCTVPGWPVETSNHDQWRSLSLLGAGIVVVGVVLGAMTQGGCRKKNRSVVVVYTSVDQVDAQPIFTYCGTKTGLRVQGLFDTEETKSTGVLNRLIAEASHPQADLFWSGDPVRAALLVQRGLVVPYRPKAASDLPTEYRARNGMWTGVAARARILLVNTKLVGPTGGPKSILDMTDPRWKGKVALANPLYGTTTMHVAVLAALWGETKTKEFLAKLKANGVKLVSSNGEVKRLVASGQIAFGLTDTEDAAEALREGAPVRVVFPDQDGMGTVVMPSVVVLIKGAPHPGPAKKLYECLVSKDVEERLVKKGSYLPLRPALMGAWSKLSWPKNLRRTHVDYAKAARAMVRMEPFLRKWVGL